MVQALKLIRSSVLITALGLLACSSPQVQGEPLQPGDISGRGGGSSDTSSGESASTQSGAADTSTVQSPKPASPEPVEVTWSADEIIAAVEAKPIPKEALELNCPRAPKPPKDDLFDDEGNYDQVAIRASMCAQVVGYADNPSAFGGAPQQGVYPEHAKTCHGENFWNCWDAQGRLIAALENKSLDPTPEDMIVYTPENTPEWADQEARIEVKFDRSGEQSFCRKHFYTKHAYYDVRDTDADGKMDEGTRWILGSNGEHIRWDKLDAEGGAQVMRIAEWDGNSFKLFSVSSTGEKKPMRSGVTDGRGHITQEEGYGRLRGITERAFDAQGHMIKEATKRPDDEQWRTIQTWRYDDKGRLVKQSTENTTYPERSSTRTITYGPHGPVSGRIERPNLPVFKEIWSYDDEGRMIKAFTYGGWKKARLARVTWDDAAYTSTAHMETEQSEPERPLEPSALKGGFKARNPVTVGYGCFFAQ